MFKRMERKRKRQEEEEELGLDEDTKEILGLNDTDSDESDSGSEQENAQSDDSNPGIDEDRDQKEDTTSKDENIDDEPTMSVAEALKDPIYLISLDPTAYGCMVCKGKLIKNAGMATVHKNANVCMCPGERSLVCLALIYVGAPATFRALQTTLC